MSKANRALIDAYSVSSMQSSEIIGRLYLVTCVQDVMPKSTIIRALEETALAAKQMGAAIDKALAEMKAEQAS